MNNRMTSEQRLTPAQLEAIRKRAEAATEGKWFTDDAELYVSADGYVEVAEAYEKADAEFIAHSREDIPALLAEVERLRTALIEIADIDDWDYGLEIAKNITFKTIGEPKGWGGIDIE